MASPIICMTKLQKHYGNVVALRGVDLTVDDGEVFGFLGPNGAGKTTAIRCMLDLIRPTAGRIEVFGLDSQLHARAIRARAGYLPGELNLDEGLTARALLRLFDALRGGVTDWRYVEELCERLQLDPGKKIKNLSKGNKQKIGIVQAFMHRPALLILDEPTSGLDPLMQREVLGLVEEAKARGATIFFSSHMLSEVQSAADRVAVVRDGNIVELANTRELLDRQLLQVFIEVRTPCPETLFTSLDNVTMVRSEGGAYYELQVRGQLNGLLRTIAELDVVRFTAEQASLEDVFLAYYGRQKK